MAYRVRPSSRDRARASSRKEYFSLGPSDSSRPFFGQAEPYRREDLQQCLITIITEATYFSGAGHLDTEDGIGADQSREAELRRLERDVIEGRACAP